MTMAPLKLLVTAYGLSGLAALGLAGQGAGALGAVLVFWLGGAAATFALAALPGVRRAFRDETRLAAPIADLAAVSLAELERDRAEDAASAVRRAAG